MGTVHTARARGHVGLAGFADSFAIWAPNGWISWLGSSWGGRGVVWGEWEGEGTAAETHWKGRTHGVWLARVHGASCARGPDGPCARGPLRADELLRIRGEFRNWGQIRGVEGKGRW